MADYNPAERARLLQFSNVSNEELVDVTRYALDGDADKYIELGYSNYLNLEPVIRIRDGRVGIILGGSCLLKVGTPSSEVDATNKAYVDSAIRDNETSMRTYMDMLTRDNEAAMRTHYTEYFDNINAEMGKTVEKINSIHCAVERNINGIIVNIILSVVKKMVLELDNLNESDPTTHISDGSIKDINYTPIQSETSVESSVTDIYEIVETVEPIVDLLPLTSDLKKLNDYLRSAAQKAYTKIFSDEKDVLLYNTLKDIYYCQIILLNKRRPAEVAQLKVKSYKLVDVRDPQQTKFQECLTETEEILLNTYNRFVIRGKRGQGVPVLFSPDMKKHFEILLKVGHNFVKGNEYAFHTSGKRFVDGTKILYKIVRKCDLEQPQNINATRLRKHLATITQLLQFSDNDMEQLSKFMGHTLKRHCSVYRMSDSVYQAAKVSKLLLLMMDGRAGQFQGKSLDEIDIKLDPVYEAVDVLKKAIDAIHENENDTIAVVDTNDTKENQEKEILEKNNKKHKIMTWTEEQKSLIAKHFAEHLETKRAPKKPEVDKLMDLFPQLFQDRKWTSVKAVVYNMYTGRLKIPSV
ncbi:hypothetical protein FQA39_LY16724 [Lamprigera yunnana]|nr:hypothetical protein FQA39_LY16724 [Lamprigera yunnana]